MKLQKGNTSFREQSTVFSIGAIGYSCLELLWRQHTHWTMSLTGGTTFLILYNLYNRLSNIPLVLKSLLGSGIITGIELLVGMIVNLWKKWNVWDYSHFRFHLLGQICPLYSFLWGLLSIPIAAISTRLKKHLKYLTGKGA